jgi:hypothetical protein
MILKYRPDLRRGGLIYDRTIGRRRSVARWSFRYYVASARWLGLTLSSEACRRWSVWGLEDDGRCWQTNGKSDHNRNWKPSFPWAGEFAGISTFESRSPADRTRAGIARRPPRRSAPRNSASSPSPSFGSSSRRLRVGQLPFHFCLEVPIKAALSLPHCDPDAVIGKRLDLSEGGTGADSRFVPNHRVVHPFGQDGCHCRRRAESVERVGLVDRATGQRGEFIVDEVISKTEKRCQAKANYFDKLEFELEKAITDFGDGFVVTPVFDVTDTPTLIGYRERAFDQKAENGRRPISLGGIKLFLTPMVG